VPSPSRWGRKVPFLGVVAALLLGVGGCGGDAATPTTTTTEATTITETTTTTTEATTTTTEATTTTSEATTTTTNPWAGFPTYSEVVASLTEQCNNKAGISGGEDGVYSLGDFLGEPATVSIWQGSMRVFCPGAMYVVDGPIVDLNQNGEPIPVGALLTVNADLEFVQLSSFD